MTGIERIKKIFSTEKKIKIMTHVVGGYPDMKTCESLIVLMAEKGVDMIEVQLPFSDPTADGPVIVQANHAALRAGITTESVLKMLERMRKKVDIPLLIMSYINPVYAFGVGKMVQRAVDMGVDGFIVPDCPADEEELDLPGLCKEKELAFVPLIAPTTEKERVIAITKQSASPFVYAVLRMGVTGRKTELDEETISYLKMIKESSDCFVAAGFGIKEKAQLDALVGYADCGIVGSELLRKVNNALDEKEKPNEAVGKFLDKLIQ
jgi:tryptophan synthase alpha chain